LIFDESIDHTWRVDARCAGADTEIFYPPRDKALYNRVAAKAKVFCNGPKGTSPCPVRANCLWFAVTTDEQHGVWGGMSHRERNALVRKWQKQYRSKMTLKDYIFKERERATNVSNTD
jgi:WhiB family redox-sensing transcriptional regulator